MAVDWVSVSSGVAGAVIGGGATLLGVRWQQASAAKEQKRREEAHHRAILQALHDELETVLEVYTHTIGSRIEALPKGHAFAYFWPVSADYFTVYNANAVFIGHLKDDDMRKALIKTYTYARTLIDSFRLNNGLLERSHNAHFMNLQAASTANAQIAAATWQQLLDYAESLREGHERLRESMSDTLRRLRKAGVLTQQSRY